ncbi:hypothetical protein EV145_11057 [Flavobacterium sp. 245]|nr:hypothetical protein EV145_11057 [Flavobacterium sp. 245]
MWLWQEALLCTTEICLNLVLKFKQATLIYKSFYTGVEVIDFFQIYL